MKTFLFTDMFVAKSLCKSSKFCKKCRWFSLYVHNSNLNHKNIIYLRTLILIKFFFNPITVVANVSDEEMQEHYDNFFEDVFVECEDKYGEIEEMNVCDNLGDHLVGNVYIKFRREEDAERAVNDLNNRWFGGRPVYAELSPVTDFREACCRQYEMGYV